MITQTTNATRKFIENNSYNNNLEVNGNLTINSNLIVLGDSTQLNTIVYTTERLEIVNGNNTTTALMVQQNTASRDIFVASNISTNVFKIANNGDVLMNGTLTAANIAGAGASVTALNMANASSGTLAVTRGGTGASTFVAGQVLIGNTTTALLQTANLTWDVANNRLGVRTASPATSLHVVGEIVATNNITSYYSDERLKTKIADITEPLEIVGKLNGFYYIPNALARLNGITHNTQEVGLSAQDVQSVLPEIVKLAPFDLATDDEGNKISKSGENYLTISYERLAPVFVEAIKELKKEVAMLKQRVADLENKKE
jgi:polyhydroxyalkanoate synthesis regulator phasin